MNISQAKELLKDDLPFQAIVDVADPILKVLNLRKDAMILDIGTGEGYSGSEWISRYHW